MTPVEDLLGRARQDLGAARHLVFKRRNAADYGGAAFSRDEGDVAIDDARAVIDAVSEWLAGRSA